MLNRYHFSYLRRATSKVTVGLLLTMLAVSLIMQATPKVSLAEQMQANSASLKLLELVNQWRVEQDLWPLKVNPTLQTMAEAQANYLLPNLDNIQDESAYHLDSSGHNPRERAARDPYNWPPYGTSAQIEVGENAAIGSVSFALNFWQTSDIHRKAALSNVYREVGMAAVPYQGGYLFIMDLGARPQVLTALVDPTDRTLYLSNEYSRYAHWHPDTAQIQVASSDGQIITKTSQWRSIVSLPPRLSDSVDVSYVSVDYKTEFTVNLTDDIAVLPGYVPVANRPTPTVSAVVGSPTPDTTTGAIVNMPTETPTSISTDTPPPPTDNPTPSNVTLVITYDSNGLTINNVSKTPLDLTGFSVSGVQGTIAIESWAKIAGFPIAAFPAGNCLQAIAPNATPATPDSCRAVRSQVTLSARNVFWTNGSFALKRGNAILATCNADTTNRCQAYWQ